MLELATVCLALNIYWEARSEPLDGRIAVAQVVMNRVHDARFPNSPCEVVFQGQHINQFPLRNRCQFSWYCDGKKDRPTDVVAFDEAYAIAQYVQSGEAAGIVGGATHYHANYVSVDWPIIKTKTAVIGDHLFYRWEQH